MRDGRRDTRGAHDRGDRGEHTADLIGVDAGVGRRAEVQQVRRGRGIDGGECGEANEA